MIPEGRAAAREADERITADREEAKFLVAPERLDALLVALARGLPRHRFTGDGANRLPAPHHFVTTIYFDTPSRRHFRTASGDCANNVKLRAKKYYDLHPSLVEVATNPSQIVRETPWFWLELKRREGARTMKHRSRVPDDALPTWLVAPPHDFGGSSDAGPDPNGLRQILAYCRELDEPVAADCVVNYRRISWQDGDGALRVTVDVGLSFYAPPPDLWAPSRSFVRHTLGPARGARHGAVLEIKTRGARPDWLEQALERSGARPERFGKFVAASKAVHGDV